MLFKIVSFRSPLLGALLAVASTLHAATVLMISSDGLKPEFVTHASEHNLRLPVLSRFLTEGTYADGVLAVLPTVTYPDHTTLITGVWPAEHGIYNNTLFDPERKMAGAWYWYAESIRVPTLWDAAHTAGIGTASVSWPVSVNARSVDTLIPEYWRTSVSPAGVNPQDIGKAPYTGEAAITSWKATPWSAGGLAAIMLHNPGDAQTREQVRAMLNKLAADPANGIARILDADEIKRDGGFPDAAFVVAMKPGYTAGSAFSGSLVDDHTPLKGTHGYLPSFPEMHASFFAMGNGVAKGREVGVIDMRQIAPTVAHILGVSLSSAKQPMWISRDSRDTDKVSTSDPRKYVPAMRTEPL